uniref:Uncharacterized protein n=1 Tax=Setaria viridis TaxID=4556 RepID=A0A4U6UZV6_SETVI|nr:hypothetical protein SEVIR_4G087900v2 [Setaria viridis]
MPPALSVAPPQSRRPDCTTRRFLRHQSRPRPRQSLSHLVRAAPRQSVASRSPTRPQPACLLTCAPSLLALFPRSLPLDPPHDNARLRQISTTGKTAPAPPRLWCPMTAGVIPKVLLRRTAAQSPPRQSTRSLLSGLRAAPAFSLFRAAIKGNARAPQ